MAELSEQPLRPNPFTAYRDAKTGQWITVPPAATTESPLNLQTDSGTHSSTAQWQDSPGRSLSPASADNSLQSFDSRRGRQCSLALSQYLTESLHCDGGVSVQTRDRIRGLLSIGRRLYFSESSVEAIEGQMAAFGERTL